MSEIPASKRITADLYVDRESNAAAIFFAPPRQGVGVRTLPVYDAHHEVAATLTFDSEGALLEVELLDLARQGRAEWL